MALPTAIDQMKAAQAKRGPRLPELGSVEPLAAEFIGLVPAPVKDASVKFARAKAKLSEARAAVHDAKSAVSDARWADQQSAREATARGEKAKSRNRS